MVEVYAPIGVGELWDRITILEIKHQRLSDPAQLVSVAHELRLLQRTADDLGTPDLSLEIDQLRRINTELWYIESRKREKISHHELDQEFVTLAQATCVLNDQRAGIKRDINLRSGSSICEQKSHE